MAQSFTVVSGPRLKPRVYGDGREWRFSVNCSCSIDDSLVERCLEENPESCLCYGSDSENRDPLDIMLEEEEQMLRVARRETRKIVKTICR